MHPKTFVIVVVHGRADVDTLWESGDNSITRCKKRYKEKSSDVFKTARTSVRRARRSVAITDRRKVRADAENARLLGPGTGRAELTGEKSVPRTSGER